MTLLYFYLYTVVYLLNSFKSFRLMHKSKLIFISQMNSDVAETGNILTILTIFY